MTSDWPIAVRVIDVSRPLEPITSLERYPRLRVFVTDGPELLGSVDVPNARADVSAHRLRTAIVQHLGSALARHALVKAMGGAGEARLPADVSVSIVVPTCDRADDLRQCLASLFAQQTDRRIEVVLVDNRPDCGTARTVAAEFPGIVFVEERRPGLSYARNAGLAASSGSIVVATDDDVVAPPDWIEKLVAPFARPEVMAATGHVLPLALETESQCHFEAYGGLGKGFEPLEADGAWFHSFRGAVPTWHLGATANAAFRAEVFRDPAIGTMEEALGAGMPSGCSEDTYLFYRILRAGHTIAYRPSAYVWHRHRRTMEALRKQIYAYSKGHVAYHLLTLTRERDPRALVRLAWSLPKTYVHRASERIRGRSDYPLSLIALEVLGNIAGPWALWQSQRLVRRYGRSAGPRAAVGRRPDASTDAAPEADPEPPAPSTSHALSLESTVSQNSAH